MRRSRILVTGFEPFGRWPVNSSWEAVRRLRTQNRNLTVVRLAVEHASAARKIVGLIEDLRPERVLLTGLADRAVPSFEVQARLGPGLAEASDATRLGRWDYFRALRTLQNSGLPCRLSADAGRYVCETTFWAALGTQAPEVTFLHLPPLGGAWTPRRLARVVDLAVSV